MQLTMISAGLVLIFRLIGIGVPSLANWQNDARWAMAAFFVIAGITHFGPARSEFAAMVPAWVPVNASLVIEITGILEIAGGIGLLLPATSRLAGICLLVFLVAVFPANVNAAEHHLRIFGHPHPPLIPRLLDQIVLFALVAWGAVL